MPTPAELVDELRRLKPGTPALHFFENVLDGIEWWNGIEPVERRYWLERARKRGVTPTAAQAWREYQRSREHAAALERAFDGLRAAVAARLER